MTWTADPTRNDGFRWRCRWIVARVRGRGMASIMHGSWFRLSNFTLLEIISITYDILRRDSAHQIENELDLSDHTGADSRKLYIRRQLDSRNIRLALKIKALGMKSHASNPTDYKQVRTAYQRH